MQLHLISFKTCPFVQRAVITLKHKQIDYDITFIDLADPPDWFIELSPLKKVTISLLILIAREISPSVLIAGARIPIWFVLIRVKEYELSRTLRIKWVDFWAILSTAIFLSFPLVALISFRSTRINPRI